MELKGKIGVYGRSLGGIPSSFLSSKVEMTIVDRSFSSLESMAITKFFGKIASKLFLIVSCGWRV